MEISSDVSPESLNKIQKIARAEMCGRTQLLKLDNKLREIDHRIRKHKDNKPYKYTLKQRRKVTLGVRNMFAKFVQRKSIQATKLVIQNFAEAMMSRHRTRPATSGGRSSVISGGRTLVTNSVEISATLTITSSSPSTNGSTASSTYSFSASSTNGSSASSTNGSTVPSTNGSTASSPNGFTVPSTNSSSAQSANSSSASSNDGTS